MPDLSGCSLPISIRTPAETTSYKDYVIMWGKDLARSIDYRETRKDIDSGRIAYYGIS